MSSPIAKRDAIADGILARHRIGINRSVVPHSVAIIPRRNVRDGITYDLVEVRYSDGQVRQFEIVAPVE